MTMVQSLFIFRHFFMASGVSTVEEFYVSTSFFVLDRSIQRDYCFTPPWLNSFSLSDKLLTNN